MCHRWQHKQAVRMLQNGGVIAYPTEAVYGLGIDPFNADAALHLLRLKNRSIDKGLILIGADYQQVRPFIAPISKTVEKRIKASWPGPVTWLLPARADVPVWLRGNHDTIALRVSAHPVASALCAAAGHALVSTSANIGGQQPAHTALQVRRLFDDSLDYIVSGSIGTRSKPSEIRDAISGKIVRPGN